MTKFLDRAIAPPGGGRAGSGRSFYHVSFRSGSRLTGSCAVAAHDYITRKREAANQVHARLHEVAAQLPNCRRG